MSERDGYVCAKWRTFLRKKDIENFAWLSKKPEELKTLAVGDFNIPKCYLIIVFDEGDRFLISWVSCER